MTAPTRAAVRAFLDEPPRFAQLVTVDAHGRPVTRTVGAAVAADWTLELLARRGHARLRQLAANPRLQVLFVAPPRGDEPPAHPAVIDYGRPVPRLVALGGRAEPMAADATRDAYRRQLEAAMRRGHTRAPLRSPEQVDADLVGLRVVVDRVRAEGFGDDALAETWDPRSPDPTTGGTT
ncbi:Pyridoxamine 5'-phosphate oxidase [Jatrophihabitans endophyticus]|uniref:Pyridoxamine 5'-phosphate oxidase n=1 Tax=Jatrophihabitans endophyticus TaxID=1206085 RepID=A0A1M5LZR8_9ACTN|nr:pyridoxamine 5'-phosphate oxidase family protein [Jatrophihabitans endophyticus]SHG70430.1 Pyridoxamine 5'-phosphate oxidase [Jatrophihabitans endophyticus]